MDLMESVGKLLAHADEPGSVSEGLKNVFERLKVDARHHAKGLCTCDQSEPVVCHGAMVLDLLNRLANERDPFYQDMPMMERLQVTSMAHSAVKIVEL